MRAVLTSLVVVGVLLMTPAAAQAGKAKKKYLNMPRGWQWPPSAEMKDVGADCKARLDALGIAWKPAPAARKVTTPIYVPSMEIRGLELEPIFRKGPFVMDCLLAASIGEVADELTGRGVAALRFSTIHDYRTIRKKQRSYTILSRHALGLAMDVYEIVFTDGSKVVVEKHYKRNRVKLRELEGIVRDSGFFRALLTPGNDPRSHSDHFHFEAAMKLPKTQS
jgi:hypothetical protein